MVKDISSEDALKQQLQELLTGIEKEPISDELRTLAEKLQQALDAQKTAQKRQG